MSAQANLYACPLRGEAFCLRRGVRTYYVNREHGQTGERIIVQSLVALPKSCTLTQHRQEHHCLVPLGKELRCPETPKARPETPKAWMQSRGSGRVEGVDQGPGHDRGHDRGHDQGSARVRGKSNYGPLRSTT